MYEYTRYIHISQNQNFETFCVVHRKRWYCKQSTFAPLGITANNQQKLKWYTCTVLHSNTVISTTCTHVQQYYVLHVVHMYLNLLWIVSMVFGIVICNRSIRMNS